ncbi:MAG: hypothetical protein IJL75_06615 [Eubacterium sp.]|nr:hypothetical protein [Eubacterium sp.]
MSDSDKELQEANRLKKEVEKDREELDERKEKLDEREAEIEQEKKDYKATCDQMVWDAESRCKKDNDAAAESRSRAEKNEKETRELLQNEKQHIHTEAENLVADHIRKLDEKADRYLENRSNELDMKYKIDRDKAKVVFSLMLVHIVCFGVFSEHLRQDVVGIGKAIGTAFILGLKLVQGWMKGAGRALKDVSVIGDITPYLILVLAVLAVTGVLITLIYRTFKYLTNKSLFDKAPRWIMASTGVLAVSISRADLPFAENWNLILIWLAIQIAFPLIRAGYRFIRDLDKPKSNSGKTRTDSEDVKKRLIGIGSAVLAGGILIGGLIFVVRIILLK